MRAWWWLGLPALLVLTGVLAPLVYLVMRASEADLAQARELLFRARHLHLLINTALLSVGVLAVGTLIALPLAWLTTRSDLPGRGLLTLVGVLPLAVPGYVMAYALLAACGQQGTLAQLAGVHLPRPRGYWGALAALSLCTFPYLFLNLRGALRGMDGGVEESARSLGLPPWRVFCRVTLPQLRPAFQAGGLLVGLHVLGDFGVVSLMRYDTFSYALYLLYRNSYDRVYAAWLALLMLLITGVLLLAEAHLLGRRLFHRTGTGTARPVGMVRLGWGGRVGAYTFAAVLALASVIVPMGAIIHWMIVGRAAHDWGDLARALGSSLSASAPAAGLTILLTLPLVYLSVRRPSRATRALERIAYLGYATPPLAFALGVIFFSLRAVPALYQTLTLLVLAYAVHFVAEAIGPIRSSLYQVSPRLEETARSLRCGPAATFLRVTLPLIRGGLLTALALVFLSAMKELPMTIMLAPLDFQTLATNLWDKTNEALFAQAAPYALAITLVSSLLVAVLFWSQRQGVH
ncbi:MAG TPA: iron ABC transporter permease [Phycisphaeraceae bacterium]